MYLYSPVLSCCFVGVGGRPLRGLSAEGRLALRRPLRRSRCRVWVRQLLARYHLGTCVVAPLLCLSGFRAAALPCAPAPALYGAALSAPRCRRSIRHWGAAPPLRDAPLRGSVSVACSLCYIQPATTPRVRCLHTCTAFLVAVLVGASLASCGATKNYPYSRYCCNLFIFAPLCARVYLMVAFVQPFWWLSSAALR